jgi:hypothetical protein
MWKWRKGVLVGGMCPLGCFPDELVGTEVSCKGLVGTFCSRQSSRELSYGVKTVFIYMIVTDFE